MLIHCLPGCYLENQLNLFKLCVFLYYFQFYVILNAILARATTPPSECFPHHSPNIRTTPIQKRQTRLKLSVLQRPTKNQVTSIGISLVTRYRVRRHIGIGVRVDRTVYFGKTIVNEQMRVGDRTEPCETRLFKDIHYGNNLFEKSEKKKKKNLSSPCYIIVSWMHSPVRLLKQSAS